MKKKLILLPIVALCLYVTLSSYSEGPAITGGINGTGSTGTTGCSCHNPVATAATTVMLELYDATGTTLVTGGYTAGTTYKIKLSGTQSNLSLAAFGFQVAVVKSSGAGTSGAVNAGIMSAAPTGTHLYTLSGINIFEHYNAGAYAAVAGVVSGGVETYSEMITWTAPVAGTGSVKIYGTINAVDGSHSAGSPDAWNNTSITIPEVAAVSPITGVTTVCVGATTPLTDPTTGGTWSSSNTARATVTSGGLVGGVSAGTTTITYATSAGFAVTTVTVNPLPNAGSITGVSSVCQGATTHLTDASAGGTWTSSNTAIATVSSTGTVGGVAGGLANISYTVTNSCGTDATFIAVTVNPLPVAGTITSGSSSICVGATSAFSDAAGGGTWSSSNTAFATVDASGVVTGVAAGSVTISYSVTNSCGTANAITPVTITTTASAGTITGLSGVCSGASITLSDGVASGTWSSSNTGVATIDASGVVFGVTAGTTNISYSISGTCGAAATGAIITVSAPASAGTISGLTNVCEGASITLSDDAGGGSWSSGSGVATVNSVGVVAGATGGVANISYTVTNVCGPVSATYSVTVNPLPSAGTITGTDSVCVGASVSLSDNVTGGTWSAQNTNATVSLTGVVTGTVAGFDSILYTVTNTCGSRHAGMRVKIRSLAACTTGVDDVDNDVVLINTYPNPSNGSFTVNISGINGQATVALVDILGKVIATKGISGPGKMQAVFDLKLPAGNYIMKITAGDSIYRRQVSIW